MQIPFNLQHAFAADSPSAVTRDAFGILLDCLTRLSRAYQSAHPGGTLTPSGARGTGPYKDFYVFDIPFAFELDSELGDNSVALDTLLQCQVDLNRSFARHVPMPLLRDLPIVYGATEEWETLPVMFARGYGDCKSLAPARVGEYLDRGINARCVHRWINREDGYLDFHILVFLPDESPDYQWEDPSKEKGMGQEFPGVPSY